MRMLGNWGRNQIIDFDAGRSASPLWWPSEFFAGLDVFPCIRVDEGKFIGSNSDDFAVAGV